MARNYDEDYLDGLIAKAKKSWGGVDVERYMSDLRDNDMKTIEERAKVAAWQIFEEIGLFQHSVDRVAEIIAEKMREQKAIDIDKACEWLEENARDYACATIRCPYGEEEEIICDVHREIVEDFRKAMEE